MATKPTDHEKEILDDRKRRRLEFQAEMKTLGKHKRRIKFRLMEGRDWPITSTGDRADVPEDDVLYKAEDIKSHLGNVDEKMQALRLEADQHQSFAGETVPIDEGVLLRRRAEREEERAATEAVRGEKWTPELVEARFEEAYKTLFRSAISGVRPREFGNGMPTPVRQMADLVAQAGNKSLRNAIAHRFKGVPSQEEVRRAEDTLGWAMDYLSDQHPDLSGFLQLGAMWRAWGAKITKKCADIGVQRQTFYRDRKEAVQLIVEGLIRDGKAPT